MSFVLSFIHSFIHSRIVPYIVFDGGYTTDDRKLKTVQKRALDRIEQCSKISRGGYGKVLPLLTLEVFKNTLRELNIAHVTCCFEADEQIAALANTWECPVMSNDSDFFIFDLKKGVIIYDYVDLTVKSKREMEKMDSDLTPSPSFSPNSSQDSGQESGYHFLHVQIYHVDSMVAQFTNLDKHMLPIFASICGNDVVDRSLMDGFYSKAKLPKPRSPKLYAQSKSHERILQLLLWLDSDKPKTTESIIKQVLSFIDKNYRPKVQEMIEKSVAYYTFKDFESDLSSAFELDWDPYQSAFKVLEAHNIPVWFARDISRSLIPTHFLNALFMKRVFRKCQIEDVSLESSHACSRPIRLLMYSIMLRNTTGVDLSEGVCEYDRHQKSYKKYQIDPLTSVHGIEIPTLDEIPSLEDIQKRALVLQALGIDPDMQSRIQSELLLVFAAMAFWIKHSTLDIHELHICALILCIIKLNLDQKSELAAPVSHKIFGYPVTDPQEVLDSVKTRLSKHSKPPHYTRGKPFYVRTVHTFSEFQSVLLAMMDFNELLQRPFLSVCPSQVLSGVFLYNVFSELCLRSEPKLYISEMLGRSSSLAELFTKLIVDISECVGADVIQAAPVRLHGKKKPKGKAK